MKERVWEKRFRDERQKVIGAAMTLEKMYAEIARLKQTNAELSALLAAKTPLVDAVADKEILSPEGAYRVVGSE